MTAEGGCKSSRADPRIGAWQVVVYSCMHGRWRLAVRALVVEDGGMAPNRPQPNPRDERDRAITRAGAAGKARPRSLGCDYSRVGCA